MKPVPAIVEAAYDIDAEVNEARALIAAIREADQRSAKLDKQLNESRETARLRRYELGKHLIRNRSAWPARGPRAKGWGEYLAKIGLDDSTAYRYMQEAGGGFAQEPTVSENSEQTDLEHPQASAPTSLEPAKANRDAWCTPQPIARALPKKLDLDPCSNEFSIVIARVTYHLSRAQNGLLLPWFGLTYVNGPYSDLYPFAEKLDFEMTKPKATRELVGCGFLVNADNSPAWWHLLIKHLHLRLDLDQRQEFIPPPGVDPSKNDRPQTLLMNDAFWRACDRRALLEIGTLWEQRGK